MKRLIALGIAIAGVLAIAACGGNSGRGAKTSGAASSNAGPNNVVAARQLPGVGSVLVDHTGKALYANNLEATGKILCSDAACNAFWTPLTISGGTPPATSGTGTLGVITRPDGSKQVTADGKPVYTFSQDSPGKASGNGFQDDFGGHHFTWNVVRAGGTTASGPAPSNTSSSSGNGYGS